MSTIFSFQDLEKMITGNDVNDRSVAIRRIWTDWKNYSEEDQTKLRSSFANKIIDLLKDDKNSRDTWHYLLALGSMNVVEAQELIADILDKSDNENIRGFAADALSRFNCLNENIIQQLWILIEDDLSLVVRVNSIRAVASSHYGKKTDDMAIKIFNLLKNQTHSAIRTNILQNVGEIGSTAVVPDLTHMMIARRTKMDKKGAALALDRIAQIHGYDNRNDLIKMIKGTEQVGAEYID